MKSAFVLMTALPPTLGHLDLIRYAHSLVHNGLFGRTYVIVCTQPDEPFAAQRVEAIQEAVRNMPLVFVHNIHQELPQEPEGEEGFWDMWKGFLEQASFMPGDYIVASETYGKTLAEHAGGIFMPYDLNRSIRDVKATSIRESPTKNFQDILPEFRKHLVKTVTFFGAESVGKTTLAKYAAEDLNGKFVFEWARPYLETVGPEVTLDAMHRIMEGQEALQKSATMDTSKRFVFQDTDLFSTLGYWKMWSPDTVPLDLTYRAKKWQSDLYVILTSEIPFEEDQLRYGISIRETTDQYWVDLCEEFKLPYVVIRGTFSRAYKACKAILDAFPDNYLTYQRKGAEYENRD